MIHPFDLQARAELAAQSLTALVDAERNGLMYFLADWQSRPPRADHCLWDYGDGSGRHVDALALLRTMVRPGSPAAQPDRGEEQILGWMMALLGDDGLTWLADEPFASAWGQKMLFYGEQTPDVLAEISWAHRGTLLGLTSRFLATDDDRYRAAGARLIDGLLKIALRHSDGLYFPEGYYRASGWKTDTTRLALGIEEYNAAVVWPAARYYAITGYQPALELAKGLTNFALRHTQGYDSDGSIDEVKAELEDHFHTRSNFMLGVLKLGLTIGRPELVAWARQGYDHARHVGTSFGWFPEGIRHRHGEVCCITDMLELALLLGRHVDRSYYADAERFGRNHLLEGQFLSGVALQEAVDKLPHAERKPPFDGRYSTTVGVVASQIGGFASRSTLNDAFHTDALALMQCCNAAGARGIYDLWHHAIETRRSAPGSLPHHLVHLRFSVATPDVRVISYEPNSGRLDIDLAAPCELSVRLPEGEDHAFVTMTPAGEASGAAPPNGGNLLMADSGYIHLPVTGPCTVHAYYRLREWAAEYTVGMPGRSITCSAVWRGETLIHVNPPGPFLPLYNRQAELAPVVPELGAGAPIESL